MKVLRSTFVAAAAIFAAACGDKVEIVQPTTNTTPVVNSVTVSPSSVTLSVGQTLTFTAIVDVSNGAATTVTWNTTVTGLTVNASTGALSAVPASAAGNSGSVCATSTADATKKGCAQVVITAAAANVPAQVSIQSVTTGGNLNTPVNPLAVAGQIDVRVNIIPGTQTPTRLDLFLCPVAGCTSADVAVASQVFTAAQGASLRFAADAAAETQSAFPQILFNINTAALTSANVPVFLNGPRILSARLTTSGASATPTATAQTSLTLANADGWIWAPAATSTAQGTSGTTANALDAAGFRYDRGGMTVTVQVVSYSGAVMTGGTMTFGSGCDASGIGARTVTLSGTTSPFTATFSATATPAGAGNVTNYEFDRNLCALNAVGETPTVTAVNAAGDALFTATAPLVVGAPVGLRLDNRAPTNPSLIQNPNLRANGWVNAAIALTTNNGATAATVNGVMVAPANAVGCGGAARLDCGVSTTVNMARVAASAAGTVSEARSAAASNTPALPAPSSTNTTYCGIFTVQDALGNEAALPAAATVCSAPAAGASAALPANHMLFGVDIANPTIAYTAASIAANARLNGATVGGEYIVTVNDTGLVGNSGMLPTSPVLMSLSRRTAGATPNSAGTTTLRNAANGATITALSATGVAAAAPVYSTSFTATTGAANHAYWTHNATAFDAAGNSASVTPRVMVYDATAPIPGAPSAATTITATGYSATANVSEDLDIQDFSFGVTFGALAPFTSAAAQIQQPVVAVSGFNAATFSNTNIPTTTTVPLPLALQANVGAGLTNMAGLNTTARSQSNLSAVSGNFVPGVVTPGTAIPLTNFATFPAITLPAGVAGTVTGNTTAATAANPANVVLTATITGATAVFNNPFSRMDFYMKDATGTRYFNVGSATAATLNDNGATRTFTFTVTINGATVYALLGGAGATFASDVVAVGIGAANGNIGMVSAAATAINVVF
jgi:hypothetical protein